MDCLFCKIINGDVASYKLYEDDEVIVILDAYPNVDGHTLIIPKKHFDTFKDIPNDLLIHINEIAKKYTDILMAKLNAKELTIVVNYGTAQKIKHYHMHLIPNFGTRPEKSVEETFNIIRS